tara:strand:- start:245 stop:679 length:435 start_codon:yes stop_codon:yes gene_type:complete
MSNNIAVASDHAGYGLKQYLIDNLDEELSIKDFGTDSDDSCDFPDFAKEVSQFVLDNEGYKGVLICGSGVGMSIAANKIPGIRAANVTDVDTAIQSVEHNNANILCLGANNVTESLAVSIISSFLSASFLNDEKYIRRVNKFEN